MSVSDENLIAEAEALSAMIHMGEKVSFGQDTAMIDRLIVALRAMQAETDALKAYIENDADWKFSAKRRLELFREQRARAEAAEAKLAEVEKERDEARAERTQHMMRARDLLSRLHPAEATVATLTAQVDVGAKWRRAFAAQSRKLQAVLHIPGVKEELAALDTPAPALMDELVEALRLADAALSGANMNMEVVEKKVKAVLAKLGGKANG
jgi:hypothetical protein